MSTSKTENKSEIVVINLSNYVKPPVVENKSKDWVLNGRNNKFYQYTIDRYNGSPTNAAIINSYVNLIYGRGLTATNANTNLDDWAKLKTILSKKDLRRIINDFYMFGEFSAQVIQSKGKELNAIKHIAKNLVVPSIANEDDEIESYWFSRNWSKLYENVPINYPAFSGKHPLEIYRGMPYSPGKLYFADPSYLAGMQYADMEEEIANLNINYIKKGLSAGYIINVPNGNSYNDEERKEFKKQIKDKLTGSPNAGDFVLSFNGVEEEITITPFPVNDAIHKQWEFLVGEARQQLLTSHMVTSPMLFGIKDNTGFGNNADELDTAEAQLLKRVIKPLQDFITDSIEEILTQYGINLDLEFIPLSKPVEEPIEMAKHCDKNCKDCKCNQKYNADDGATESMASSLIELGEELDLDKWVLLSTADVDYDTDDDLYGLINLATNTGVARPNARSKQDSEDILIRYRYTGNLAPQRTFCRMMMVANKLYRKEDILQMENSNSDFDPKGETGYSIWLWKGGGLRSTAFPNGTCRHKWQREIYLNREGGTDVNSPLAQTISTSEARRRGYKVPVNDSDVSIAPHNNKS